MDQNEKEGNEEQEQVPGSSYDVHHDGTKGTTVFGDNSRIYQDHRRFLVVVTPGTGMYFQKFNRLKCHD